MDVHTKKQIIISIVVLICLVGVGFIYRFYQGIIAYNNSAENPCSAAEYLGIRGSDSDCNFSFNNYTADSGKTTLTVSMRTETGEILSVDVPRVDLKTDQTFLTPRGGSMTIMGSKAISVPKNRTVQVSNPAIEQINSVIGPGEQSATPSVIPDVVTTATSSGSSGSGSSGSGVFVPIVQNNNPGTSGDTSAGDNTPDGDTGPSQPDGGIWIGYYDQDTYIPIDLSWLGYFELENFEIRSYQPPEIRVLGTRNGQPFEALLILDENNQIRTLYSSDPEVYAHD